MESKKKIIITIVDDDIKVDQEYDCCLLREIPAPEHLDLHNIKILCDEFKLRIENYTRSSTLIDTIKNNAHLKDHCEIIYRPSYMQPMNNPFATIGLKYACGYITLFYLFEDVEKINAVALTEFGKKLGLFVSSHECPKEGE